MNLTAVEQERFWAKVAKTRTCWLWTGTTRQGDGGVVAVLRDGKQRFLRARRVSWALCYGSSELRRGALVILTCDNKLCVRPEHLMVGDHKTKVAIMLKHGRGNIQTTGEKHPAAKFNKQVALFVRAAVKTGLCGQGAVGRALGISQTQVHRIVNKKVWA